MPAARAVTTIITYYDKLFNRYINYLPKVSVDFGEMVLFCFQSISSLSAWADYLFIASKFSIIEAMAALTVGSRVAYFDM